MNNAFFEVPIPINEPIKDYVNGSQEKEELLNTLNEMKNKIIDIPMIIDGKEITTDNKIKITAPHDHNLHIGNFYEGDKSHVKLAIDAALKAKKEWSAMSWQSRASIFLKAAELLAGPYRSKINASTMLGQSKNVFQAEIDAACEFIDFLNFNASYMEEIYKNQPESSPGMWNRLDYRPLEGFVFAISPFNFTSIAGNLCASPALMGNTVIWKPAYPQIYLEKGLDLNETFLKISPARIDLSVEESNYILDKIASPASIVWTTHQYLLYLIQNVNNLERQLELIRKKNHLESSLIEKRKAISKKKFEEFIYGVQKKENMKY